MREQWYEDGFCECDYEFEQIKEQYLGQQIESCGKAGG